MNLILLSRHFIKPARDRVAEVLRKEASERTLAFCSNAGDNYPEANRGYIGAARNELLDFGYKLIDLDLRKSREEVTDIFDKVDCTFFTGGDPMRLIYLMREIDMINYYKSRINSGLVHIGFSAGAIMCGDDFTDYHLYINTDNPQINKGLGYFKPIIIPHFYTKIKYTNAFEELFKKGVKDLIPLTNEQGILVNDEGWEIVQE